MLDIIYSLFSAIVDCISNIISLITSIPRYVNAFLVFINALIPAELLIFVSVMFFGAVIIHIKRLIIS